MSLKQILISTQCDAPNGFQVFLFNIDEYGMLCLSGDPNGYFVEIMPTAFGNDDCDNGIDFPDEVYKYVYDAIVASGKTLDEISIEPQHHEDGFKDWLGNQVIPADS